MNVTAIDGRQALESAVQKFQEDLMATLDVQLQVLAQFEAQLRGRMEWENTPLNLQEGARESGYSPDHLGRLVKAGEIPNAGRENAPRILRKHLPRKPGVGLTPPPLRLHGPDARSALQSGGVER